MNTFSTVAFHDLVLKDGTFTPQTFQRSTSGQGNIYEFRVKSFARSDVFPTRPPSNLPPAGNEHLCVALGEALGSSRTGTVHHATLLTHYTELPPLVIKVSRYKWSENMEQDAWFYEELEQMQGIAVPRCYSFFQAHVEQGNEVSKWKSDSTLASSKGSDSVCELENNKTAEHPDQADRTLLLILLLERLGEKIPLHQPFDTIE